MNTPSPLVPQGTLPDRGKSRIRIIVFAIIAAHVFMLGVFLIAGCKKTSTETAQQEPAPPPVTPPVEPLPLPPAFTNVPATPGSSATATAPVPADTNVVLPPPPPPIESIPPPAFSEHTIIKGETFAVLAKRYGVTTKAIEAANPGVNPTRLKIGQKIKIPPPKPATNGTASGNGLATTDGAEKTYTVKSGDNLMKIAKSFGVTVKQLRSYNNLRTDQIKVGQKLKIPMKAPPVEATLPPPAVPPLTNP